MKKRLYQEAEDLRMQYQAALRAAFPDHDYRTTMYAGYFWSINDAKNFLVRVPSELLLIGAETPTFETAAVIDYISASLASHNHGNVIFNDELIKKIGADVSFSDKRYPISVRNRALFNDDIVKLIRIQRSLQRDALWHTFSRFCYAEFGAVSTVCLMADMQNWMADEDGEPAQ